jgi:hypothetical protein
MRQVLQVNTRRANTGRQTQAPGQRANKFKNATGGAATEVKTKPKTWYVTAMQRAQHSKHILLGVHCLPRMFYV